MNRSDRLIEAAALSVQHIHDPVERLSVYVGKLLFELRHQGREIDRMAGVGLMPQAGCGFIQSSLDDAKVLVEYEYAPEEAPVYDLDSPMCGPGHPAEVNILGVLVNGHFIDAGYFTEEQQDKWEQEILDGKRDAHEAAMCEREAREAETSDWGPL